MLPTKFRFILPSAFRGDFFLEIDQSETIIDWQPWLLMNRKDMSNFNRGPYKDAPIKFRFIWPSGFRADIFFRNQPIRNKNCLWRPRLFMNRDKISKLKRGPFIDASYQDSPHLAERCQRRNFKCEKLTDDVRWTTDTK